MKNIDYSPLKGIKYDKISSKTNNIYDGTSEKAIGIKELRQEINKRLIVLKKDKQLLELIFTIYLQDKVINETDMNLLKAIYTGKNMKEIRKITDLTPLKQNRRREKLVNAFSNFFK